MKTHLRWWAMASAIALIAVPVAQAAPAAAPHDPEGIQRLKDATGGRALISLRDATGTAQFVRLSPGKGETSLAPSARGADADAQVKAFFNEHGGVFGIRNAAAELQLVGSESDAVGFKHLTYQQMYRGIPVFGAVLKGHVNADGQLVAVNGTAVPDITVDTVARRSADEVGAKALAIVSEGRDAKDLQNLAVQKSQLVVFRTGLVQNVPGGNHLAYEVEVSNKGSVREFVYIDAQTGKKLDQITGIHDGMYRRAYDGAFEVPAPGTYPSNYPDNPFWVEGDPFPTAVTEANNMILASEETYDLFFNSFGRDSLDGAGIIMDSIFNRGYNCPNASWNGVFISFCNGFTTDDVTGHEWGHAYTQYSHGLIYQWQSGALNESYSDIWGEAVDLLNSRGTDTPNNLRTGACSVYSPPVATLTVNSPGGIAGAKPAQSAAFGPALTAVGITGDVVIATDAADGTGPSTTDGCTAITNAIDVAGKIALIDRGSCNFTVKVKNAQDAGATAVIIANNISSGLPGMGGSDVTITIPSVGILQSDGNAIKANIAAPVNVTMNAQAGTDDSVRWLMGEDVTPGGALRDMSAPNCYANPSRTTDAAYYHCGPVSNDAGGVHYNSGVPNKMFQLLVDGGTFNSQTVTAIGLTKALHIYYRASLYQVPTTDFPAHADAMDQACSDLIGVNLKDPSTGALSGQIITVANCQEVADAALAVELRTPPNCGFTPYFNPAAPTNICGSTPALQSGTELTYFEDFEGTASDWTRSNVGVFSSYTPRNFERVAVLPDNRAGSAFFALNDPRIGDCGADDQSGVRYLDSPVITIPSDAGAARLVFDQWLAVEPGWDGGNIKLSVNGGPWVNTAFNHFSLNPYTNLLFSLGQGNTNPLAGQQVWTGTDGGSTSGSWGTSVLNLSAYASAGDTIQFRFAFGQDGCGGRHGWYVDDVKMYSCKAPTISINDIKVKEGSIGTTTATFTVTLSQASSSTVTVNWATAAGTATAGSDYVTASGAVTFAPFSTTRTIDVTVNGDVTIENDETFTVNLSSPFNAFISDSQGLAIITNDDTNDLNGDGSPDLLFRNTTNGTNAVWYMNGVTRTGTAFLPAAANLSQRLVALGDFDGDGDADIVWRNQSTGANSVWFMNGVTMTGAAVLDPTPDLNYRIVGAGDFNADGKPDLVFRNYATGANAVWYMNGTTRTGVALLDSAPDVNWGIGAITDMNGDTKPDLVFRNYATGANAVWFMNGATKIGGAALPSSPDVNWRLVGAADFNGDGHNDLIWRNQSTGVNAVWYMNGTTQIGGAAMSHTATSDWRLVPSDY